MANVPVQPFLALYTKITNGLGLQNYTLVEVYSKYIVHIRSEVLGSILNSILAIFIFTKIPFFFQNGSTSTHVGLVTANTTAQPSLALHTKTTKELYL